MYKFSLFFAIFCLTSWKGMADSYQKALIEKRATLDVIWYTSTPFVYHNAAGQLTGLEYEILLAFQEFLKERNQIDLEINWQKADSFHGILDTIRQSQKKNLIGVSAFSITDERKKYMRFSEPYLPDITVLVSSEGTPIVRNFDAINKMMNGMTAITIEGTVYERFLLDIKTQLGVDFKIKYIHSDQNVLDIISKTENSFGFIDMLIYMLWIKDGSTLTRQNFFTVRGTGYAFALTKSSDWQVAFEGFMNDSEYHAKVEHIISKYIGSELHEFIDNLYEGEPLGTSILTKEKEIQLALIKNANLRLEEEENFKMLLMFGIGGTVILLLVICVVLYNNQRTTKILLIQKNQIEQQQADIHLKNDQLVNRNQKLIALNEEKNQLVSILAHDLRAPLGHITGLIGLMKSGVASLSEEEQGYFDHVMNATQNMNQMINKILDVDALDTNHNLVYREKVDISSLIKDLAVRYRPTARKKGIDLNVASEENLVTDTDHILLFLILENLLSNAIKFSGAETTITFGGKMMDQTLLIQVEDQGPGFTKDDQKRVFGRFQRLSATPTGEETSTGLGLSIVKKYTTDLGGKVWLESQVGKGSTFFVSLPC